MGSIDSLYIFLCSGKGVNTPKITFVIRLFEMLKMVYPPKRAAKGKQWGPFDVFLFYNGLL